MVMLSVRFHQFHKNKGNSASVCILIPTFTRWLCDEFQQGLGTLTLAGGRIHVVMWH